MTASRRLAAILAADVAGYSRLIGANEGGTLERLRALRRELLDPKIAEYRGRLVKTTGDGLLVEFGSVVDALRCAAEVQRRMIDREPEMPDDQRTRFRISINLGDVIAEEHDIFGDHLRPRGAEQPVHCGDVMKVGIFLTCQHPFAGTSRSRHRTRFAPAPANTARASPTSPRSGHRVRQEQQLIR
jgi:hypothetical protein